MRFAHLSDVHLGYRQFNRDERYNDFFKVFNESIEKIIENNCDFVVISGDLFDTIPKPHVINETISIFSKLKKENIPVYIIEGNHDKTERVPSPIILLSNIGFVKYVGFSKFKFNCDQIKEIGNGLYYGYGCFEDVHIHGINYRRDYLNLPILLDHIPLDNSKYNILMFHQTVSETDLNKIMYLPESDIDSTDLMKYSYDYVALGHIHKRYIFSNKKMAYSGSLEMCSISEADYLVTNEGVKEIKENRKGFFIVDQNGKINDIFVDHRKSYYVNLNKVQCLEDLFSVLDDVPEGSIVSIKYGGEKIDESSIWRKYSETFFLVSVNYVNKTKQLVNSLEQKEIISKSPKIKQLIKEVLSFKKGRNLDVDGLIEFYSNFLEK